MQGKKKWFEVSTLNSTLTSFASFQQMPSGPYARVVGLLPKLPSFMRRGENVPVAKQANARYQLSSILGFVCVGHSVHGIDAYGSVLFNQQSSQGKAGQRRAADDFIRPAREPARSVVDRALKTNCVSGTFFITYRHDH